MHKLYELKEKLVKELEGLGSKELSTSSLDMIDKLAHATKNIAKVIEACEEEAYSMAMSRASYDGGSYYSDRSYADESRSYDSSSNYVRPDGSYRSDAMSHARGRRGNVSRDSMGRYSRAGEDIKEELHKLMGKATDEQTRQEISRLLERM